MHSRPINDTFIVMLFNEVSNAEVNQGSCIPIFANNLEYWDLYRNY